uniref:CPSF73-100_C domain-containing protein n=1 Tax=Glossina pallidipes TaxID=7398 RepID=A0A1A9ZGY9_GLOPL
MPEDGYDKENSPKISLEQLVKHANNSRDDVVDIQSADIVDIQSAQRAGALNTHSVELYFRGEKTAKVMGSLAATKSEIGNKLSGVLVKRDFKYHLLAAADLSKYSDMSISVQIEKKLLLLSPQY